MSDDTKTQNDETSVEVIKAPAADALERLRTTPLIVEQFHLETIAPPEADAVTFALKGQSVPGLGLTAKLTCGASSSTFQGWTHTTAVGQEVGVKFVSVADFTSMDDNYPGIMIPCTITSGYHTGSTTTHIGFSSSGTPVPRQRTPSSIKFDYALTAELTLGNHLLRTLIGTDRITQSTKFYLHIA